AMDVEDAAAAQAAVLALRDPRATVKAALDGTPGPRAKARLEAMARWLDPDFGRAELGAIWKDRWFVMEDEGKAVGVEHQLCTEVEEAGNRLWRFQGEAEGPSFEGDGPMRIRSVVRVRPAGFRPVDSELEIIAGELAGRIRFVWNDEGVQSEFLAPVSKTGSTSRRRSRKTRELPPVTVPEMLLAETVERASLARIEGLDF